MSQLLSALPVGSLVKQSDFVYDGSTPIFRILEHGHGEADYCPDPAGSTTLEFRDIIKNGMYGYINSGSSLETYPKSYVVWLNSEEEGGFLTYFPSTLKSALMTVTKTQRENGPKYHSYTGKLFILSRSELGSASKITKEGSKYSFFSNNASRIKTLNGIASSYWTRSGGLSGHSNENVIIDSSGDGSGYAMATGQSTGSQHGYAAAFCLPSDTQVSDSPGADGAYTLVWNQTPTISPATTNYGSVATPPAITCTIADADGDSFTYTVKLNGVTKTSGSATASKTFALDMASYWSQMALGTNTIVVQATDSKGATGSATYTMNKTNSAAPVPTTDLVNNSRKDASFYIGFQIGQDEDGDSQTVVAQVADNSSMTNPTEFSSVEKLVAGAWIPVQTLTNADAGSSLRIQVTGQTVGDTIYVRLKDTDSGSGSPVYTSTYAIKIGSTLEFDTLPISRTTKPSIVVAYLDKTITNDATVQMYACNNANDATPTWEPITEGESHQFTNKTKTAANWGISVKTNIAAGATAGEISVSAVGLGVL